MKEEFVSQQNFPIYIAEIEGLSPLIQGQPLTQPKRQGEADAEWDFRCWRDRMHVSKDGFVMVPSRAFELGLVSAASRLQMKIPGKGKSTYTKRFAAGIQANHDTNTGVRAETVEPVDMWLSGNPTKGDDAGRVHKWMPYIPEWRGEVEIMILDGAITSDVLLRHLQEMGLYVGVGSFRPEKGNKYGRFRVVSLREK